MKPDGIPPIMMPRADGSRADINKFLLQMDTGKKKRCRSDIRSHINGN